MLLFRFALARRVVAKIPIRPQTFDVVGATKHLPFCFDKKGCFQSYKCCLNMIFENKMSCNYYLNRSLQQDYQLLVI